MQSSGIVSLEKSAFLRQRVEKSFSRFQKKTHKTQPLQATVPFGAAEPAEVLSCFLMVGEMH